jgi:hypothetical protein
MPDMHRHPFQAFCVSNFASLNILLLKLLFPVFLPVVTFFARDASRIGSATPPYLRTK